MVGGMNHDELIERLESCDAARDSGEAELLLSKAAAAIRELVAERDALLGLIRFALAPHVHPDMIEAMIRDALAGGRSDE
jgi:hypothetical protein